MGTLTRLRALKMRLEARRFGRDRSGATAVEFAMVAAPLLFMLFAILELALVFLVSSSLENATSEMARKVRTGLTQGSGTVAANTFRDAICTEMGWLQTQCAANLSVDVRPFAFTGQTAPSPIQTVGGVKTFNASVLQYDTGSPGQIVLVRAFYRWKLITPFLQGGLERMKSAQTNGVPLTMLTAATTFRNEPFGT